MTISRGQMNRQLYMGGGIMNAVPREQYGFGSIFKGVKKAVKGVTGAVKDIASSDIGKAALIAGTGYYLGGGQIPGLMKGSSSFGFLPQLKYGNAAGSGFGLSNILPNIFNSVGATGIAEKLGGAAVGEGFKLGTAGKFAALAGVTGFLTSTLGMSEEQAEEEVARDPSKYLSLYYKNLNPNASEQEVQEFVTANTSEYAEGGRIGYAAGSDDEFPLGDPTAPVNPFGPTAPPGAPVLPNKEMAEFDIGEYFELFEKANPEFKNKNRNSDEYKFYFEDYWRGLAMKKQEGRGLAAMGGRMNYALGDTASQNAMQAASVEGLPMRQNPKGVQELDLRDNGGFIPPVGIKEKEDDIPAMLSNNEFVFTADAVRGMGDGNVNVGAQRMYDMMKKLEAGGSV